MAKLTPEQLAHVEQWAADGANLNQIQDLLKKEYDITLTYLDARLLMLDVGVKIKDKAREKEKEQAPPAPPPADELDAQETGEDFEPEVVDLEPVPAPGGAVTLTADQIAMPGALISGKVTFSDGQTASWFLDQMGRLGLSGAPQGYQPPKADIPSFQNQLDGLLQRAGY